MTNLLHRPAPRDRTAKGGKPRTKLWITLLTTAVVTAVGGSVWLNWPTTDGPAATEIQGHEPPVFQQVEPLPTKLGCPKRPIPNPTEVTTQQIAAPKTVWTLLSGIATPSAPGVGPATINPLRACYSHDPWGALYAATNYAAQLVDPNTDPAKVVEALCADTPDRAAYVKQLAGRKGTPSAARPYGSPQWTGFHFVGFARDFANLELAHVFAGGVTVNTVSLHWADGDWKVVIPAPGDQRPARAMEATETYFTPWAGA